MNMRSVLLGFGGVLLLGGISFLLSPFFYDRVIDEPAPAVVMQLMESEMGSATSSAAIVPSSTEPLTIPSPKPSALATRGSFVGLLGHQATGTALRVQAEGQDVIRFEDDFVATNGPDLFVYLGKEGKIDKTRRLSALKGNKGAQNYVVPPEWRGEGHDEVWIWCRAFSVVFARAELR